MNLDIKTISITISVIVLGNAFISFLAWRYAKSQRAIIGYWSLSQILVATGLVLVTFRTVIPDFVSVIVANACIIGSQIATQEGITRYMGKEGYLRKENWAIWSSMLAGFIYFTYVSPSVGNRIVVFSIAAATLSLLSIITLKTRTADGDAPRRALIAVFFLHQCLTMYRALVAILQGGYAEFLNSGLLQAWGMIGAASFYASLSLIFFWLIAHRLGLDSQRQALTDPLTGLSNRRAMDNVIGDLLPTTMERNIGFLIIDIDGFKKINDSFGHQAGDGFLVLLGQELSKHLRSSDAVFRYAGDEFVVLTQKCDEVIAMQTAERLRQMAEKLVLPWMEHQLQATISVGIALSTDKIKSIDELMRIADEALYRAKDSGGNCVMLGKYK